MIEKVVKISDCNRCPHRAARTDEYPSDFCRIVDSELSQHTTAPFDRPITPPKWCPLRKGDFRVRVRYTLAGQ